MSLKLIRLGTLLDHQTDLEGRMRLYCFFMSQKLQTWITKCQSNSALTAQLFLKARLLFSDLLLIPLKFDPEEFCATISVT